MPKYGVGHLFKPAERESRRAPKGKRARKMGALGHVGHLGCVFGSSALTRVWPNTFLRLEFSRRFFKAVLGHFWAISGPLWRQFPGNFGVILGPLWASWGYFGASWSILFHFGAIFGPS